MKIFVITLPKAGTYLIAEILKKMGFEQSAHISTHDIIDLKITDLDTLRANPDVYVKPTTFTRALEVVKPNHFAVGHIPCQEPIKEALLGWKKIFAYRNMRDIVISAVRYYSKIKHPRYDDLEKAFYFKSLPMGEEKIALWMQLWGEEHVLLAKEMAPWLVDPSVMSVRFESLIGVNGSDHQLKSVKQIATHVGKELADEEAAKIITDSIATTTSTSTGKLSDYKEWWTPNLETIYTEMGFREVKSMVGLWI